jgi:Methyltransferase domain
MRVIEDGLRYLRHAPGVARAVAADPVEAWIHLRTKLAERQERDRPACPYQADHDWERHLHEMLDAAWPCEATSKFRSLWPQVMEPFEARRTPIGRGAFAGWGDGEPGLVRAVWCVARHLRPSDVVETGVARGFTTRFILEALERNGAGSLWSVDLPPPLYPELHVQIGAAVSANLKHRWNYVRGSSRRRLPGLLGRLKQVDMFVHDSRHSERNVRFELDQVWAALRPGGVVVVDDIDMNWGFHSFMQTFPGNQFLICYAEPLRPDPTRFEARGLFGIARKADGAAPNSPA